MAISVKQNGRRYKAVITIVAGTPIFAAAAPLLADRILIQMLTGGSGRGLVYDDVPSGMTPAQVAAGGDVAVELSPASASAPGGTYSDTQQFGSGPIDLSNIAIDGSHTGDTVLINARLKI